MAVNRTKTPFITTIIAKNWTRFCSELNRVLYPPTCNVLLIEFEIDLLQNTNSVQVEFLNDIQVPEHISLV